MKLNEVYAELNLQSIIDAHVSRTGQSISQPLLATINSPK